MKKRNQLVSALLAGLIVGGMAGTTVWADSNDQLNNGETAAVAEAEAVVSEETAESTAYAAEAGGSEEASAAEESSQAAEVSAPEESSQAAEAVEASPAAVPEKPAPAEGTGSSSEESSSSAAGEGQTEQQPTATANPEDVDGKNTKASVTTNTEDVDGKTPGHASVTDPSAGQSTNPNTNSTGNGGSGGQETPSSNDIGKSDVKKEHSRAGSGSSSESGQVSGRSSSSGGRTSTGTVNYVLTDAQRRQNLTLGFQQVAKKYAVVTIPAGGWVNIREEANTSARVVGKLNNGGLCYILSEEDGKWYYVESGDVRGFVSAEFLTRDTAAIRAVSDKGGETKMELAQPVIDALDNKAYRYKLTTVKKVTGFGYTADRAAMIQYAMQFLGRPYVWGGEDLWNGCDCSGYVRGIYSHFGISLPRCSYEQCDTGTKIEAKDARPGDLLFYARNGVVYHVLMYIGNGQAINAQSSATGIVISNVDYSKVCWATTYINDAEKASTAGSTETTSTQATSVVEIGRKASDGDTASQQQIISYLGKAAQQQWNVYGFLPSVQIAQVIQESGWLSFSGAANGGIQPEDNNVLGMNAELLNDQWISPWQGTIADRNVPQSVNGQTVYDVEAMRTYPDIESCLNDEAAFKIGIHPNLKWVKDVDQVITEGLKGYATDPSYESSIKAIIDKYNLTQFDVDPVKATGTESTSSLAKADTSAYTTEQIQLIWAVVAQEDDMSYDGALAVITTAMNRADQNYGGYGTNALAQLTADGQFCYSPKVSNPIYWQRRLGGNVPDFVVQAVSDCLNNGVRSHNYLNFKSSDATGSGKQIGSNWYY